MKKNYFYLLFSLSLLFLFTSCQKDNIPTDEVEEIEEPKGLWGLDYLNLYVKQAIVFHYSEVDKKNKKYKGWFIDNEGKVFKYNTIIQPDALKDLVVKNKVLQKLKNRATPTEVLKVDADEYVTAFDQMEELNFNEFQKDGSDASQELIGSFYAYQAPDLAQLKRNSGCPACNNTPEILNRILLSESGNDYSKINKNEAAKIMMNFLDTVKEKVGN